MPKCLIYKYIFDILWGACIKLLPAPYLAVADQYESLTFEIQRLDFNRVISFIIGH